MVVKFLDAERQAKDWTETVTVFQSFEAWRPQIGLILEEFT